MTVSLALQFTIVESVMLSARALVLIVFGFTACEPGVRVRIDTGPPQRTITEMHASYDEEIGACQLPVVSAAPGGTLASLDGRFRVQLPGRWPATTVDTSGLQPSAFWLDDLRLRSVRIAREMNGHSGPAFAGPSPNPPGALPTCEVTDGDAGAIWRRYDRRASDSPPAPRPFYAYGEVITRDSLRYRVIIAATTATGRDSLASWVSLAVIGRLDGTSAQRR